jgi:hypothetical protein
MDLLFATLRRLNERERDAMKRLIRAGLDVVQSFR